MSIISIDFDELVEKSNSSRKYSSAESATFLFFRKHWNAVLKSFTRVLESTEAPKVPSTVVLEEKYDTYDVK
ncbi:hypothetical protein V1478_013027 [Vespula squamosa]|uniref:Uncharacterized protein n=1 Tax=Vespula squamosa TaxID=30214 RepID=A0ABD2A9T1_VESSQ